VDLVSNLALGFQTILEPANLLVCVAGVTLGMLVGVLPGIGAMAAISMLLPLTWHLEPATALILLAGIFYGGQYGGSTASILLNLPGTAANAVTCLDGYPMARQGRAGVALVITTLSSFVGASVAIVLMMTLAPVLARAALGFGPSEYFAVMTFALVVTSTMSGAALKGFAMVALGALLGMIGVDIGTGQYRFTFGSIELAGGLNLVAVAMGLLGVAEILSRLSGEDSVAPVERHRVSVRSLLPTRRDIRDSALPTLRGTVIGTLSGILPGTGATLASFLSYAVEKRVAADPSRFGRGAIEGVAAPEAANNAAVQAAFIPTLTLGIPGDAVMAILLGAMLTHGVTPGPMILENDPALFWGLVASFWLGNLVLLVLNIPLIGLWVRLLSVPYRMLFPVILCLIGIGVYSINYSTFDILVVVLFGILGYGMKRLDYPAAPLLFGFILGPMVEDHLRRALLVGHGDPAVLVASPVSAGFLVASVLLAVLSSGVAGRVIRGTVGRNARSDKT
jgi:TctA family transporter